MSVKVFVLGRPGSGKSTAVRHIIELANREGCVVKRIKDYPILHELFQEDMNNGHKKFRPVAYGGFDVCDFSVLDTALEKLELRARERMETTKNELLLIEFARDDYSKALKHFSHDFLCDAYFLFVDADVEMCIQRIHKRVDCQTDTEDNHFVSDNIVRSYYSKDNKPYMANDFTVEIGDQRVKVVENIGSLSDFIEVVDGFAYAIFEQKVDVLFPAALVTV